jgi:hypothetical protein
MMEFTDLKVILSSFGLWVKVSAAYNPDGSVKDFKMLEKLTEKLARSERAIIRAMTGLYHNRNTVSFTELYNALDRTNTDKLIYWWSKNFETEEAAIRP